MRCPTALSTMKPCLKDSGPNTTQDIALPAYLKEASPAELQVHIKASLASIECCVELLLVARKHDFQDAEAESDKCKLVVDDEQELSALFDAEIAGAETVHSIVFREAAQEFPMILGYLASRK